MNIDILKHSSYQLKDASVADANATPPTMGRRDATTQGVGVFKDTKTNIRVKISPIMDRRDATTQAFFLLGITTLHNGMILSTLSISSHGFALGFPKMPHTNGDSIPHL